MIEILLLPFMQRAMLAGILVGFIGSYYGTFIVQRKMSFMGDGLAHAAFGGIALGLLLNAEPLWIALPFTIAVSLLITLIKDKTGLEMDTSIGILFAVSVALGIVFISLKKEYATDAFAFLFGSILTVSTIDLILTGIIAIISFLSIFKYWKRWAYATFDAELAKSDRMPVKKDDYILSVLIAVSIVLSIKLVGIVLIAAFLVIPAAASRLISGTFFKMTVMSVILGIVSSVFGLIASVLFDLPSGAAIILVQALIFLFCMFAGKKIS